MSYPVNQGLYDSNFEHENCGVGFVVHMKGKKSHDIVLQGLELLTKLEHRGACGADPLTGDGAGLLIQLPHQFFKIKCGELGIDLPEEGRYGSGLVFARRDEHTERRMALLDEVVKEEGLLLLGWRQPPVDNTTIGQTARNVEPEIRQVFVGAPDNVKSGIDFERKLYVIRKRVANAVRREGLNVDNDSFYIVSLSSRTFVYKGQLMAPQVKTYCLDLTDPNLTSALALAHSRYSTNTFPSWGRAQPFRFIAHNGEINTIRGNKNWMRAREAMFESPHFKEIEKILPVIAEGGSDSADFDQGLELLAMTGRSLPHSIMMMIPEPWSGHETMDEAKRNFYEFHASMMEPWDGPASIAFTNGEMIGAILDRNGLRPSRYIVTKDDLVVMASEVGVLPIDESNIIHKGRLQPGKMFLVDMKQGRIIADEEIKGEITGKSPYGEWLAENQVNVEDVPGDGVKLSANLDTLLQRQTAFGYTAEDIKIVLSPMVSNGSEATGSMGNDAPLAVLSDRPQNLFNYFKQLFAQVTNPAIDSISEEMVMSMEITLGKEENLLSESGKHCGKLKIKHPIITLAQMEKIRSLEIPHIRSVELPMLFKASDGEAGLEKGLKCLCESASQAIRDGATVLILSDRGMDKENAPIPSLLATAAVHHHLLRERTRTKAGIVVETGETREMMHFALLIGYGAGAVYPYLAYETALEIARQKIYVKSAYPQAALENFILSTRKGLFKIIAKMGISTIQSYRGAQIFEAVGLADEVISKYFTGTASRVKGAGLDVIARETLDRHQRAFYPDLGKAAMLNAGGNYSWRRGEEKHMLNPNAIALLQHSTRSNDYATFKKFSKHSDEVSARQATLRGLMKIKTGQPIPIEEVEPVSEITKRFCTGLCRSARFLAKRTKPWPSQ